jgi:hypothetical protein
MGSAVRTYRLFGMVARIDAPQQTLPFGIEEPPVRLRDHSVNLF